MNCSLRTRLMRQSGYSICWKSPVVPLQHVSRYHSYDHPSTPPYSSTARTILSAALQHVPITGFSAESLRLGAKDVGYLSTSTNLFPQGAFDLVAFYLVTRRLALQDLVNDTEKGYAKAWAEQKLGMGSRVRTLLLDRLKMNVDAGVIQKWPEALALMAQPTYAAQSIAELGKLSDEIWFLAGDTSVDTSWYTKRGSLAALYATAELYQTQDTSKDGKDTEQFVDSRLMELKSAGDGFKAVTEWAGFTGHSIVNTLRSKGMRI